MVYYGIPSYIFISPWYKYFIPWYATVYHSITLCYYGIPMVQITYAAFESPRIDRVNEEKHILITTQLVHTTCNSKVSKQHKIVSLTLADDKMVGGCNPESVKSKKKLL